ncbi:MAG: ABC transporter substrate-binding protein [Muribaculaceae bacterium]
MCSCTYQKQPHAAAASSGSFDEARLIDISSCDGYSIVTISDPWNAGKTLHTYVLVPKNQHMPESLPEGSVIRTPVNNALVYSSVHAQVIKDLGKVSAVRGICDAEYYKIPEITRGLKNGTVLNVGSSMAPSLEKIIALKPEVIVLSPFHNGGYGALANIGIPILECADYMEESPLGRAEWIKLFGILFGEETKADSIFASSKKEYLAIKDSVKTATSRPKVITEMLTSGVWFVPGGKSYMAKILSDAGAVYPWSDNNDSGSLQLDIAQVLDKASDADVWLIKSSTVTSCSDLQNANPLNAKFRALANANVWVCDPQATTLFEEFPFHPERLLKEYALIFHPELFHNDNKYKYFTRLQKQ